jgi:hypothetical protein
MFPVYGPKQELLENFMRRAVMPTSASDPLDDYDQFVAELPRVSRDIGFVPAWMAIFAGLNVAFDVVGRHVEIEDARHRLASVKGRIRALQPRRRSSDSKVLIRDWVAQHRKKNDILSEVADRAHRLLLRLHRVGPDGRNPKLERVLGTLGRVPSKRTIERWLQDHPRLF